MNTIMKNSLFWLLLFVIAGVFLTPPLTGQKSASGNFYGLKTASGEMAVWEGAPRRRLGGLAWKSVSGASVGANSAADSAWSASVNSTDLAALRSNLGIGPDLQTLAIARSNVPGLEGVTFNGGSPAIYDAAGLPRPEPGPISSPNPLPLFQNHAEQDIANQFVNAVNNAGLTQAELAGRNLNIMISNPTGVCTICAQGLSNPNVAPGVLMQLSNTYPGLNINVLVDTVPSIIPKTGSQITILGGARVNP
jgi:hypothetical protein